MSTVYTKRDASRLARPGAKDGAGIRGSLLKGIVAEAFDDAKAASDALAAAEGRRRRSRSDKKKVATDGGQEAQVQKAAVQQSVPLVVEPLRGRDVLTKQWIPDDDAPPAVAASQGQDASSSARSVSKKKQKKRKRSAKESPSDSAEDTPPQPRKKKAKMQHNNKKKKKQEAKTAEQQLTTYYAKLEVDLDASGDQQKILRVRAASSEAAHEAATSWVRKQFYEGIYATNEEMLEAFGVRFFFNCRLQQQPLSLCV
jgi:hypothetical protein